MDEGLSFFVFWDETLISSHNISPSPYLLDYLTFSRAPFEHFFRSVSILRNPPIVISIPTLSERTNRIKVNALKMWCTLMYLQKYTVDKIGTTIQVQRSISSAFFRPNLFETFRAKKAQRTGRIISIGNWRGGRGGIISQCEKLVIFILNRHTWRLRE